MFFRIEENGKTSCYYEFNTLDEFFAYVDYALFHEGFIGFNYGKSKRTGIRIINFLTRENDD